MFNPMGPLVLPQYSEYIIIIIYCESSEEILGRNCSAGWGTLQCSYFQLLCWIPTLMLRIGRENQASFYVLPSFNSIFPHWLAVGRYRHVEPTVPSACHPSIHVELTGWLMEASSPLLSIKALHVAYSILHSVKSEIKIPGGSPQSITLRRQKNRVLKVLS